MTPSPTSDLFPGLSRAVADLAERAAPSIVQVRGRPRRPASGMVVAPDRIITTSHSVEWEDGVKVQTHDGRTLDADIAGHAPGADLVLLKVPGLGVPVLADSSEPARPGQLVVIAGRAWSSRPQVRLLEVSGVAGPVRVMDGTSIDQLIALPVAPYPGVSGSAVLDADGRVAAMASAGFARGRVFGLPVATLRATVVAIEAHGGVTRGFVGVTTHPVTLSAAQAEAAGQSQGLVVLAVAENSPAAAAGVLVGDVLIGAGAAAVSSADDLLAALTPDRVGSTLSMRLLRGRTVEEVPILVAARPSRW